MSAWSLAASVPEFLWELSLGVYLTIKGFRTSATPVSDGVAP